MKLAIGTVFFNCICIIIFTYIYYLHRGHYYLEEGEKPPKGFRVDTQFPSHDKYQTVKEFIKSKDIHVIYAKDIKAKERKVKVPEEGYVWKE